MFDYSNLVGRRLTMEFDYSKLLGAMREKGVTQADVAKVAGVSETSLRSKLKNRTEFRDSEMLLIKKYLDLPNYEDYFFTLKLT